MNKIKKSTLSKIITFVLLFLIIVVPIVRMLFYIDGAAIKTVFSSNAFGKALVNSFTSTITATIISLIIAYALAWAINRSNIRFKGLFSMLLVLPMLIPSVSHGMGLTILFGNNGVITKLFSLNKSIYGFKGVVAGSVLYSFPVAFLMISDILKYEDYSPYEAAEVLGIGKARQFTSITFPYLRKPLISVVFTVFTLIVTDYGVPIAVGGQFKTLPVMLYEEAVGALNYSTGSVIGVFLLIPAIIAFLFDFFNKDKGSTSYGARKFDLKNNILRDVVAYVICIVVTLFTALVIFSFCIQAFTKMYPVDKSFTFNNFIKAFDKRAGEYLLNSVLMSTLTALVGTVIAFVTAYLTARIKTKTTRFLHLISIVTLAVPGLVLGLSYVILFKKSFIYGTLVILILVNTVHFFASPYLMIYNAFGKMNENLEDVGEILGVSRLRIIFDVIIPQSKYTIAEMLSYFFVNSMMTISAVSFLATPDNKPLSLLINQFESQNMLECAAVVAILILFVNAIVKIAVLLFKKIGERNKKSNKENSVKKGDVC